jgi:transcriptional regulator with XRE-family HTH domain
MKNSIAVNIRYLRKLRGITQDQLADKIAVNRAMIGSYEEGRAVPRLPVLQAISHYFNLSIDQLINERLENSELAAVNSPTDKTGQNLRILSTIVDRDNQELISLVPVKASAGYMKGYADPDFIETLPQFQLPFPELSKERSYRAFQISGNSMEPIPTGSYIICEYVQNWFETSEGKTHILITREDGILYKRVYKHDNENLLLKSDNPEYVPFMLPFSNVCEIWKALAYISFNLPEPDPVQMGKLTAMVYKMQNELEELKKGKPE